MKVRPAHKQDVERIATIIAHHASQGLMLPRSMGALSAALDSYVVADTEGQVVGCGGLDVYTSDSAEIYGLATAPDGSPPGTGKAIVQALIARARKEKIAKVFALTLAPGFFTKLGFKTVAHADLPLKVWKDCIACPKYGNCDEVAMVLDLN
jgi:N-acetylglutamate synthase-like GNAT family acetyltransferase